MITYGTEFDNFEVEPGMELESFDMKQSEEIFLNHPFKILMFYLGKHPPGYSRWDGVDLCDFYFEMLDDYNRYGISFKRENNLFPVNFLYVKENNNSKKEKYEYQFKSKYNLLLRNNYDKKTLLFNKVKKIDLNKYDKGDKPLSEWEKIKRKLIKKQKNEYLKVAMMDPNVYNNDEFFEKVKWGILDDYNAELKHYPSIMFTDKSYDKYIKRKFEKIIDMVKNIDYLINEGNYDYLGILGDNPYISPKKSPRFSSKQDNNKFNKKLFKYTEFFDLAKKDPDKSRELFLKELKEKKIRLKIYKKDPNKAQKLVLDILEFQIKQFEKANDDMMQKMYLEECDRIIRLNGYCI